MDFYTFTKKLAADAACELRARRKESFAVAHKHDSSKDIVTSLDVAMSHFITARIQEAFPTHAIHSEETAPIAGDEYQWVIDPIDGTANFSRGIPHYGISIGLLHAGVLICGVVIDPSTGDCFHFTKATAYTGETVLQTSNVTDLAQATVLFAGGRCNGLASWAGQSYTRLLQNTNKTKNLGSSALDICYVAAGRAEAYVAGTLSTKDIAAALGILQAAGGVALTAGGDPVQLQTEPQKVYAANSLTMAQQLIELLES